MDHSGLADWLARLERLHPKGIDLGLDRVRAVADRLGLALGAPTIVVGGTNGKGSTCAMLDSVLRAAGYRTGLYTSPHLLDFNERARINGKVQGFVVRDGSGLDALKSWLDRIATGPKASSSAKVPR